MTSKQTNISRYINHTKIQATNAMFLPLCRTNRKQIVGFLAINLEICIPFQRFGLVQYFPSSAITCNTILVLPQGLQTINHYFLTYFVTSMQNQIVQCVWCNSVQHHQWEFSEKHPAVFLVSLSLQQQSESFKKKRLQTTLPF